MPIDERSALLGFNLVRGIGPRRLSRLITTCGSAAAAWQADEEAWREAGLSERTIQSLVQARERLDLGAEWALIERAGITAVAVDDTGYPALLRRIAAPPPLLFVRGALARADRVAVAIVGTRTPSAYGREVAAMLARDFVSAGVTVVSGLALGIDGIAHRGALDAGGRTLAVLGCGLSSVYPAQHRGLASEVEQRGALLSEYAPSVPLLSGNFAARNRLISGLSLATIVVEAGSRSGALITAQFALEQGRPVFAVPGSILSPTSAGPNALLAKGALPACSAAAVLKALGLDEAAPRSMPMPKPETPAEEALLALLSHEPCHIDALGYQAGLAAHEVAATLGMMELRGMVRQPSPLFYTVARYPPDGEAR